MSSRETQSLSESTADLPKPDLGLPARVRIEFGAATHPGRVRTNNEDHFLVARQFGAHCHQDLGRPQPFRQLPQLPADLGHFRGRRFRRPVVHPDPGRGFVVLLPLRLVAGGGKRPCRGITAESQRQRACQEVAASRTI